MMLLEAALLWTIFYGTSETVLQYGTEKDCHDAIEDGLPYTGVPPKDQLSCIPRPNHNPIERCLDGSVADLRGPPANIAPGRCKACVRSDGSKTTSSLCEAHGYKPVDENESDGHQR
jgi:hypothetical protein